MDAQGMKKQVCEMENYIRSCEASYSPEQRIRAHGVRSDLDTVLHLLDKGYCKQAGRVLKGAEVKLLLAWRSGKKNRGKHDGSRT